MAAGGLSDGLQLAAHLFQLGQLRAGMNGQIFAGRVQPQPSGGTLEKIDAKMGFERQDLAAQGRRGQRHMLGGLANGAELGNGVENFQVVEVLHRALSRQPSRRTICSRATLSSTWPACSGLVSE